MLAIGLRSVDRRDAHRHDLALRDVDDPLGLLDGHDGREVRLDLDLARRVAVHHVAARRRQPEAPRALVECGERARDPSVMDAYRALRDGAVFALEHDTGALRWNHELAAEVDLRPLHDLDVPARAQQPACPQPRVGGVAELEGEISHQRLARLLWRIFAGGDERISRVDADEQQRRARQHVWEGSPEQHHDGEQQPRQPPGRAKVAHPEEPLRLVAKSHRLARGRLQVGSDERTARIRRALRQLRPELQSGHQVVSQPRLRALDLPSQGPWVAALSPRSDGDAPEHHSDERHQPCPHPDARRGVQRHPR